MSRDFRISRLHAYILYTYPKMSEWLIFFHTYLPMYHLSFNAFIFQKVDDWNFDVFSFARATKGSPLKFLGNNNHIFHNHCFLQWFWRSFQFVNGSTGSWWVLRLIIAEESKRNNKKRSLVLVFPYLSDSQRNDIIGIWFYLQD